MPWFKLVMGQHIQFDMGTEPNRDGKRTERTYRAGDVFESEADLSALNGPGMTPKFEKIDRSTAEVYADARRHYEQQARLDTAPYPPSQFRPDAPPATHAPAGEHTHTHTHTAAESSEHAAHPPAAPASAAEPADKHAASEGTPTPDHVTHHAPKAPVRSGGRQGR